MTKKVKISNEKLAELMHMHLMILDISNADEIYEEVSSHEGYILLRETEGIEVIEEGADE